MAPDRHKSGEIIAKLQPGDTPTGTERSAHRDDPLNLGDEGRLCPLAKRVRRAEGDQLRRLRGLEGENYRLQTGGV